MKILEDRAYSIYRNCKYSGYREYYLFDRKTGSRMSLNEQLAEELHKSVIKNFEKGKAYVKFKNNIWGVDLADM